MRPETEAKIMVAFLISLVAFGCGSGLGIAIGLSNDTLLQMELNNTSHTDRVQISPSNTNYISPPGSKDGGVAEIQNTDGEVYVQNNQGSFNNNTTN